MTTAAPKACELRFLWFVAALLAVSGGVWLFHAEAPAPRDPVTHVSTYRGGRAVDSDLARSWSATLSDVDPADSTDDDDDEGTPDAPIVASSARVQIGGHAVLLTRSAVAAAYAVGLDGHGLRGPPRPVNAASDVVVGNGDVIRAGLTSCLATRRVARLRKVSAALPLSPADNHSLRAPPS